MRGYQDDLAGLSLFSEVSRGELAAIRRHLTLLFVPAGSVLMREGARGEEFMIMADGVATVSRDGRTVATLERGDIVGEMALLDEQGSGRCNATVMVKSDSLVYAGSRAEFHRILESVPAVDRSVRQAAAIRTARRAA